MYLRRCTAGITVLWLVMMCNWPQIAYGQQSQAALDLLEKAYSAFTSAPPVAYDAERLYPSSMRLSVKVRQRGQELDILTTRYDVADGEEKPVIRSRAVCDSKRLIHYDTPSMGPLKAGETSVYFTNNEIRSAHFRTARSQCAFLDGWSEPDNMHFTEVLKNADRLVLHDEMEKVGNSDCYVVESFGRRGHYKVWIDADHGYHIRKAIIEKKADDLYQSMTIRDVKGFSFRTELEVTKFEKIEGIWFATENTEDRTWEDNPEQFRNDKSTTVRSNIQFNPNFDAMGAFELDIPDGTWVQNLEFPTAQYVWKNGRILPYIERHALEVIEEEVQNVKDEAAKSNSGSESMASDSNANEQQAHSGKPPDGAVETGANRNPSYGSYGLIFGLLGCIVVIVVVAGVFKMASNKKSRQ